MIFINMYDVFHSETIQRSHYIIINLIHVCVVERYFNLSGKNEYKKSHITTISTQEIKFHVIIFHKTSNQTTYNTYTCVS